MAISDRQALGTLSFEHWLESLRGIDMLQIREKDLSDLDLFELTASARKTLPSTTVVVNGRPDIALAAGAHGVHLPANGLPVAAVRRAFGDQLTIGCSTHSAREVEQARREGADYVVFGPLYPTPGKRPPVGPAGLRQATGCGIPVLALGGVTQDNFAELADCGAAGAAGIRLFLAPSDVQRVARAAEAAFA